MSSSFSANQYDSAFKSSRLQNWTVPKAYKEKPSPADGHTMFIATDRGHLLPDVKRGCPWPSFKGTWDLPNRIPPVCINPTARSQEGQKRLRAWGQDPSATANVTETKPRSSPCKGYEDNRVSTPAADGPEPQRPTSQASQKQSRPATQQSQTQAASTQTQTKSRPPSQTGQT